MVNFEFGARFRRRDVFHLASAAGAALLASPRAFAGSEFWDKQKPADWTDKDKEELQTKSPWAKKVDADMSGAGGRGGGRGSGGTIAGADSAGGGGGGRGGGGGGRGGGGGGGAATGAPATSLEIVWQSAKPILDAHPLKFPAKLDNHYIIGVSGIPIPVLNAAIRGTNRGGRGQGEAPEPAPSAPSDPSAGLKRGATLNVKGKEPQNADLVMSTGQDKIVFFAFTKDTLALAAADKDVEFILKLGGMTAKAKFNLKDMMYNGELAL